MLYATKKVSTSRTFGEGDDATVEKLKFDLQVPQYESIDEYIDHARAATDEDPESTDAALKCINAWVAKAAADNGRQTVRTASDDKDNASVIQTAQNVSKGYKPSAEGRGPGKAAQIEDFQAIMAKIKAGEMPSAEELQAIAAKY